MYAATIFILGVLPTLLLFVASQYEAKGPGPAPLKVMAWTWLLGYTLKCIYLGFAVVYDLPFRPDWVAFYIIDIGQFAITLAVVSLIAGYFLASAYSPSRGSIRPVAAPRIDWRFIYWAFFALSLGLIAIYFQQMGFIEQIRSLRFVATKFFVDEEGDRSALGFLAIGGDWLVVFFIYWLAMSKKLTKVNIYTVAIGFVSLTMFLSSRRNTILAIIIVALIVLSFRHMQKLSAEAKAIKIAGRLGILATVLIFVSFSSQIRDGSRAGQGIQDLSVFAAIEASATHAFEGAYFIDPAKTAGIIDRLDTDSELFLGSTYATFLLAPIPRVMWEDKPNIRLGPFVAQDLFTTGGLTGFPPGGIGELYLNFGWLGIPFGMALFGAFLSFVRKRQLASSDQRFAGARYALLCMVAIYFVTVEFTAAVVIYLKYAVAIFIVERYWAFQHAAEMKKAILKSPAARKVSQLRPRPSVAR
ncbi:MAG: oligosaccharide repeat unit polymerase [Erythrobacter sp.]|nr:MAG: oligosaccharide repeat unit polymerase [Erythrobacter sp.]